jgi:hypothetical protein
MRLRQVGIQFQSFLKVAFSNIFTAAMEEKVSEIVLNFRLGQWLGFRRGIKL